MKEKYELIPLGEASHLIRKYKKHWWSRWQIEMDGETPKIYPVDQENCEHDFVYVKTVLTAQWPYNVPLPLFRCKKCGYEQFGKG